MPLDPHRLLNILLADLILGTAPPRTVKVRVEREDGVVYEWTGENAAKIAGAIGLAIIQGHKLPAPVTIGTSGEERPDGEPEH